VQDTPLRALVRIVRMFGTKTEYCKDRPIPERPSDRMVQKVHTLSTIGSKSRLSKSQEYN